MLDVVTKRRKISYRYTLKGNKEILKKCVGYKRRKQNEQEYLRK
jgi:hypothetical protein